MAMRATGPTTETGADAARPGAGEAPMVRARGLTKRYGRFVAVNGIDLDIRRGEIFGILGPNGAGKSTTLEMLEGIRTPDAGTMLVDGLDVARQKRAVQARIGVQLQATTLFPLLTLRETLAAFGALYPRALAPDALLREVNLAEKARAFPQDLSGGQRQRFALALALVGDPALLFLDEPTTGLDPQSRHLLWETVSGLRARGKTIILTTHFMDEAQALCDRIAIMDSGAVIAQDTPAGLIGLLGASATIEFRAEGPGAATLTPEALRTLPAATDARAGTERTLLYTEHVEPTLTALLRLVESEGARIDHLQVHAPTLEDVFLKLTGRGLRD